VRYAVESIPPMICGVSPPLGLDIDIGPREPGLYTVHAVGTYHGTRQVFGAPRAVCRYEAP